MSTYIHATVDTVIPWEGDLSGEELSHDAPHGPYINCRIQYSETRSDSHHPPFPVLPPFLCPLFPSLFYHTSPPSPLTLSSPPLPSRPTLVVVLHPVEHDLRGPVPPGSHVACHLISRCPSQSKVKDAKLTTLVHCNVASLEVLCMGRHWTVTVEGLDQGG